jgi:hypothetical protein
MTSDPRRFSRITNGIGFTVFAVWAAVTLSKIPAVGIALREAFPEYADYKRRVGALCPLPSRRTARQPDRITSRQPGVASV